MKTVQLIDVNETTELAVRYRGQNEQQPCYVQLDCRNGQLSASFNGEIGNAIPFSVYHGHDRRWGIRCLTADSANELLREIAPLAQDVLDGYSSEWDGNNNVARLTEQSQDAENKIERICDGWDTGTLQVIDADEYATRNSVASDLADCDVPSLVARYDSEALVDGLVLDGTAEYIQDVWDSLHEEA